VIFLTPQDIKERARLHPKVPAPRNPVSKNKEREIKFNLKNKFQKYTEQETFSVGDGFQIQRRQHAPPHQLQIQVHRVFHQSTQN
jgi:hypothetical protein